METTIQAALLAGLLSSIEPDRGNRYAPRSVRTKGEAAHEQWILTCRVLATGLGFAKGSADRRSFLAACGIANPEEA